MKKRVKILLAMTVLTLAAAFSSYAGQWKEDSTGWWYDNGNGTWPANCWQWIDGNGDGIAECYYFNQYGYCLMGTYTPDGYWVNANGAWEENGVVQAKNVGAARPSGNTGSGSGYQEEAQKPEALMLYDAEPVLSKYVSKKDSGMTNKEGATWAKVLEVGDRTTLGQYWPSTAFTEYYAAGNYNTLKAVVAPMQGGWEKDEIRVLQVLGNNDEVLYESDEIDYRTSAFEIDVDITGQDTVTIYSIVISGMPGHLILKQARFE